MLGFGPISCAAIAALPDSLTTSFSVSFVGRVTFEAAAYSPYRALLTSGSRLVYTVEIDTRVVR